MAFKMILSMMAIGSFAQAAPQLSCVAGKVLPGQMFQTLTLNADQKTINTDFVNKSGQHVDLQISDVNTADGKLEISGTTDMNKGTICAGSCPNFTYKLALSGMPDTQDNAILTVTQEGFSEMLGLHYVNVTSSSYVCKSANLGTLGH